MRLRTGLDVFRAALLSALGATHVVACGGSAAVGGAGPGGSGNGGEGDAGGSGASAGANR